jgi:ribonuclease HII
MGKTILPSLRFERAHWAQGALVAGVDEVGRGPLAGPLVAAAVVLPTGKRRKWYAGIRDSKVMTAIQRREVCERILANCENVGLGLVQPWDLDRMGMTAAWNMAMHKAIVNAGIQPDVVLIDGKMLINPWASERPTNGHREIDPWAPTIPNGARTRLARSAQKALMELPPATNGHHPNGRVRGQQAIVDGDARCMSIAAASIVAKVARDHIMETLHFEHPQYNWLENKGYSTPFHKRAIREHGTCAQHRMLFAPVRLAMQGVLIEIPEADTLAVP